MRPLQERFLFAIEAILKPPQFTPRWSNQKKQPASVKVFCLLIGWFDISDLGII
jgi:hypothetical protein